MNEWDGYCQRCFKKSMSHIMSMIDDALICSACKRDERRHPDYRKGEIRDLEEHANRMAELGCPPSQVASVRETARKMREGEL